MIHAHGQFEPCHRSVDGKSADRACPLHDIADPFLVVVEADDYFQSLLPSETRFLSSAWNQQPCISRAHRARAIKRP